MDLLAKVLTPTGNTGAKSTTFTALTLKVSGADAGEGDIPSFSTYRPCYLADTRGSTPAKSSSLVLGTGPVNTQLNGVLFSSETEYLDTFEVGTLNEIVVVQGAYVHSLHVHVFPFQLTSVTTTVSDVYFQVGDWMDILNIFTTQIGEVTVRFWADRYTGYSVVHCHVLNHEDNGMLNTYLITGTEGTTVDELAHVTDPRCTSNSSGQGYSLNNA